VQCSILCVLQRRARLGAEGVDATRRAKGLLLPAAWSTGRISGSEEEEEGREEEDGRAAAEGGKDGCRLRKKGDTEQEGWWHVLVWWLAGRWKVGVGFATWHLASGTLLRHSLSAMPSDSLHYLPGCIRLYHINIFLSACLSSLLLFLYCLTTVYPNRGIISQCAQTFAAP